MPTVMLSLKKTAVMSLIGHRWLVLDGKGQ